QEREHDPRGDRAANRVPATWPAALSLGVGGGEIVEISQAPDCLAAPALGRRRPQIRSQFPANFPSPWAGNAPPQLPGQAPQRRLYPRIGHHVLPGWASGEV